MADQGKEDESLSDAKHNAPEEQVEGEELETSVLDEEEEITDAGESAEEGLVTAGESVDEENDGAEETATATTMEVVSVLTEEEEGVYPEHTRETSAIGEEEVKNALTEEATISAQNLSTFQTDFSAATVVYSKTADETGKESVKSPTREELALAGTVRPETRYLTIFETIINDLGAEVLVEQQVPILEETTEYERVSLKNVPLSEYEEIEQTSRDSLLHYYVQKTNYLIEKTFKTDDGEDMYVQENIAKEFKYRIRPPLSAVIFRKTIDEDGNEILQAIAAAEDKEGRKDRRRSDGGIHYSSGTSEDEISIEGETLQIRYLHKEESRLNERLKNTLIKIAIEKKKQKKLIKLISLSINMAENPGKKRDPKKKNKPDDESEWVFRNKGLEDWKPLYLEQLLEHKNLRTKFLAKLEIEKKKMDAALDKAKLLDIELDEVRQTFIGKLKSTVTKLKPKTSAIFKIHSPEYFVEQIAKLELELMQERKVILEKQSRVDLLRKNIEIKKKSNNSLCNKFDTFTKEIDDLNGKNDRRFKKLEVLKKTIRDNCLSLAHTDQKLVSARRNIANQNEKLAIVQDYLLQNRMKRQEIHRRRILVEKYIQKTVNDEEAADYQMLQKEYENLQTQMNTKKTQLLQMKHDLKEQQSYFAPVTNRVLKTPSKSAWKSSKADIK